MCFMILDGLPNQTRDCQTVDSKEIAVQLSRGNLKARNVKQAGLAPWKRNVRLAVSVFLV